jgi:hypothetical protein
LFIEELLKLQFWGGIIKKMVYFRFV